MSFQDVIKYYIDNYCKSSCCCKKKIKKILNYRNGSSLFICNFYCCDRKRENRYYCNKDVSIVEATKYLKTETIPISLETQLFKPFMKSLRLLGNTFAEEIHKRSIVEFDGNSTGKYDCRCELADIAILLYSVKQKLIKLTLNQVKLGRSDYRYSDGTICFKIENRYQWLLLSKRFLFRPYKNYKTFSGNVLKKALLPSIGSFGIFHKEELSNEYEFNYFVADTLVPSSNKLRCKLEFKEEFGIIRSFENNDCLSEINACPSLSCFYCALKKGLIGSPVNHLLNDLSFYNSLIELIKEGREITNKLDNDSDNRKDTNNRILNEVYKLIEDLRVEPNGNNYDNHELFNKHLKFSIRNLVIVKLDDLKVVKNVYEE